MTYERVVVQPFNYSNHVRFSATICYQANTMHFSKPCFEDFVPRKMLKIECIAQRADLNLGSFAKQKLHINKDIFNMVVVKISRIDFIQEWISAGCVKRLQNLIDNLIIKFGLDFQSKEKEDFKKKVKSWSTAVATRWTACARNIVRFKGQNPVWMKSGDIFLVHSTGRIQSL